MSEIPDVDPEVMAMVRAAIIAIAQEYDATLTPEQRDALWRKANNGEPHPNPHEITVGTDDRNGQGEGAAM